MALELVNQLKEQHRLLTMSRENRDAGNIIWKYPATAAEFKVKYPDVYAQVYTDPGGRLGATESHSALPQHAEYGRTRKSHEEAHGGWEAAVAHPACSSCTY